MSGVLESAVARGREHQPSFHEAAPNVSATSSSVGAARPWSCPCSWASGDLDAVLDAPRNLLGE